MLSQISTLSCTGFRANAKAGGKCSAGWLRCLSPGYLVADPGLPWPQPESPDGCNHGKWQALCQPLVAHAKSESVHCLRFRHANKDGPRAHPAPNCVDIFGLVLNGDDSRKVSAPPKPEGIIEIQNR